jgi:hypothetical protein
MKKYLVKINEIEFEIEAEDLPDAQKIATDETYERGLDIEDIDLKEIIKQRGPGTGKGENVKVLAREEIEKIIEDFDPNEALLIAYRNMKPGYENGYCAINLETGNIFGYSIANNTYNHACDNNYINIFKFDQHDSIEEEDIEYLDAELLDYETLLDERYDYEE